MQHTVIREKPSSTSAVKSGDVAALVWRMKPTARNMEQEMGMNSQDFNKLFILTQTGLIEEQ